LVKAALTRTLGAPESDESVKAAGVRRGGIRRAPGGS
jgi:hypothetical protein